MFRPVPAVPARPRFGAGAILRAALAAVVLACACPAGALAQAGNEDQAKREMRSIERAMDLDRRRQEKLDAEAAEHAKELEGLRRESVAVAKRVQDHEAAASRSEEHTSELQSLMRTSYAVFCLTK